MPRRVVVALVTSLALLVFWGAAIPFANGAQTAADDAALDAVAPPAVLVHLPLVEPSSTWPTAVAPLAAAPFEELQPDAKPVLRAPVADPEPEVAANPEPDSPPRPARAARVQAASQPQPDPEVGPAQEPAQVDHTGTSHFWFPGININASWDWYGCGHGGPTLGAGVYRWGCAPDANVYLLGHAWSTFKKLKAAYHSGALQEGQHVWYANPQGRVTEWRVKWIKHVTDNYLDQTFGEWAANDSSTPIMTLQTCDGANDLYRIIVRLVPAD